MLAGIVSEDLLAAQGEMLCNRVKKNLKRLRKWSRKEGIECYRLYDRDIPEIPLVLDWYQGRLHIAEFQRKHASEDCGGEAWMKTVVAMTALELQVPPDKIYYKVRDRQRGQKQYQARGAESNRVIVQEAGHSFLINLVDYLDTGLFLDHRTTRAMVAAEAKDKSVLNLFCYTGSFSVYAGAAGAANTLGIDLSATYLEWARANLNLNDLDAARHRLSRGDVQEVLAEIRHSASASILPWWTRRPSPTPNASKGSLICSAITSSCSKLCTRCSRRVAWCISRPIIGASPSSKMRSSSIFTAQEISAKTLPEDFRDKKIHRCWRLEKTS